MGGANLTHTQILNGVEDMPVIHSYCKLNNQIFYIHSIVLENGHLVAKLLVCEENKIANNTLWSSNKYCQTSRVISISLDQLRRSTNLNAECQTCRYYKSNNFILYKRLNGLNTNELLDDFSWGICSLRNDAFQNGCMELYVDCPYIKRDRKNFFVEPTHQQLESFILAFEKVFLLGKNIFVNRYDSGFYILTPNEFMVLKSLIDQGNIIFTDCESIDCNDETAFCESTCEYIDFHKFTLDQLYYYFMNHLNCSFFNERGNWGITWVAENTAYKFFGNIDLINNYTELKAKNTDL